MKKTNVFLLTATILLVALAAGCGSIEPTIKIEIVTQPASTNNQAIVPSSVPVQPAFAPECPADPPCAPLDIQSPEAGNTYCVRKIPYQNFSLPAAAVIESLDPSETLECKDSGTTVEGKTGKQSRQNGYHIWTCTGEQLQTYQIKVANPACKTSNRATNTDKCQAGMEYDTELDCCANPPATKDASAVIVDVNIGACPVPPK